MELVVHKRDQPIECRPIAALPFAKQQRHVERWFGRAVLHISEAECRVSARRLARERRSDGGLRTAFIRPLDAGPSGVGGPAGPLVCRAVDVILTRRKKPVKETREPGSRRMARIWLLEEVTMRSEETLTQNR